jgi:hypothetical protein
MAVSARWQPSYIQPEPPKRPLLLPMRVLRESQLRAALRQHERQIVIEDQDLARPFVRLLRARDMSLRPLGTVVAEMMSFAIRRSYGSDVEANWYIGRYVLPGNVQKVILRSKTRTPRPLVGMNVTPPDIRRFRAH